MKIIAQFGMIGFDVSIQEMASSLVLGATLCFIPEAIKQDMPRLLKFLSQNKITKLFLPTPALGRFVKLAIRFNPMLDCLNEIIVAGDQLIVSSYIKDFFQSSYPHIILTNQYGPSETHVVTSYSLQSEKDFSTVYPPIGEPIANITIQLQNEQGQSIGAEDELGDLTVFYNDLTNNKYYVTGDMCNIRNGIIRFIGRQDDQIKLSGFRVDLSEITLLCKESSAVKDCVVRCEHVNSAIIVAYLVLYPGIDKDWFITTMQANMLTLLPGYMQPKLVICDAIPYFSNGKIAYARLPKQPELAMHSSPVNQDISLQRTVLGIYQDVMHCDSFGLHDDFFNHAGASLQAITIMHHLERVCKTHLTYSVFLRHPTPFQMVSYLNSQKEKIATKPGSPVFTYRFTRQNVSTCFYSSNRGYALLLSRFNQGFTLVGCGCRF